MTSSNNFPHLWLAADPDLFADPAQAHVWHLPLDVDAGRLAALTRTLSPDEHARAARLPAPADRARFAAGRGAVRAVLAGYRNTAPEPLRFTYSPHGKPELTGEPHLHFSVTHSEDLALLAVSAGCRLGIDLERLRTDFALAPLAARLFTPAEQETLAHAPPADKHRVYWTLWTAKEAYLKALGTGLDTPLNCVVLPRGTGQVLSPAPDFVAALVVLPPEKAGKDMEPDRHNA